MLVPPVLGNMNETKIKCMSNVAVGCSFFLPIAVTNQSPKFYDYFGTETAHDNGISGQQNYHKLCYVFIKAKKLYKKFFFSRKKVKNIDMKLSIQTSKKVVISEKKSNYSKQFV